LSSATRLRYIANVLQHRKSNLIHRGKPVLAALLIGLVLLLDAMAAAPALHELIHKDANEAGHECVVTLFAHGQVESAACDIPVILPAAFVEAAPLVESSFSGTTIENLPPGRAPPAPLSSPRVES
jgi:hypothetical protein